VKFRPIFDTKKKGLDSRYTYAEMPDGRRRSLTKDEVSNLDTLPSDWKLFTPSSMLSSSATGNANNCHRAARDHVYSWSSLC
jgi:hypothetical protein